MERIGTPQLVTQRENVGVSHRQRSTKTTKVWKQSHFSQKWDREKRARNRKRNDPDPAKKQAPTALLMQKYAGMKPPDLPIRSSLEPGMPTEQHKKLLSDDPKRGQLKIGSKSCFELFNIV